MDRLSLPYDSTEDILHRRASGFAAEISCEHCYPFVSWSRTLRFLFRSTKLHRLYRSFGHVAAEKLHNQLRQTRRNDVSTGSFTELQKFARICTLCQFETARLCIFKFTLREETDFHHSTYVDIIALGKLLSFTYLTSLLAIR